ncbi:MAG: uroporphyrinogen-III C-methyltransferase [Deltaproteobacteria bacterium]|nr:uroporphyrinogen-III C-methyltransferase [Deltaproteobacteria bacterium]
MSDKKVYLIGAGPGDPELITVKGKQSIKKADIIIYDYLASSELLQYASETAEIIYVGKKGGAHTLSQNKINKLLIQKAKQNNIVARLKGGDPFIFGRGGEEAEELKKAGIDFEIIPGVTSAIAAPAYAGIPLSHRKFTSTIAFITGHENPEKETTSINWAALTKIGTLVFLMGVKNLPNIVKQLKNNQMNSETPAAVIRWGTTPKQKTVTGTLDTIAQNVKKAGIKAPAIILIGKVATLKDTLNWYEKRPLFGKTVLVTRARHQASELVKKLNRLGALCVQYPTIQIMPAPDYKPLDTALEKLNSYQWIIFTSVNGVTSFFERLFKQKLDSRALGGLNTASIGPATAEKLKNYGIKSDIIPKSYVAESIIEAFSHYNIKDKKILLPRAKEARTILPEQLKKMGAIVQEIISYKTEPSKKNINELIAMLENKKINIITFTSSSTVKNFKALIQEEKFDELTKNIKIASIGPVTTETAKKLGFKVSIEAKKFTIDGLCQEILKAENIKD